MDEQDEHSHISMSNTIKPFTSNHEPEHDDTVHRTSSEIHSYNLVRCVLVSGQMVFVKNYTILELKRD